jgi:DNA processing protein
MMNFNQKLILLHHWRGITWLNVQTILTQDPTLTFLKQFTVTELKVNFPGIKLSSTLSDLPVAEILILLKEYQQSGIHVLTFFDEDYPSLLKETYQPPWVLFAKGRLQLLRNNKKIAVVGSREASTYAKMTIHSLFPKLIDHGFIIISGLAKGVDTISHETAIKLAGGTIAVIAGGFFHIYPKENLALGKLMMESQLVISEYPPDTRPERWHFPMRNRIISGMSIGTVIIEAKKKSGSLITASLALNEGREVFAVPGTIFSANSVGTNELIQQGAKLVQSANDIIEEFNY